jgi:DNA-binding GntR family transcriptional regulator
MAPRKGRNLSADQKFSLVVDNLSGGYKTVGQMVYAVLKEGILSGAFEPGEWLRQESLAEAIGVSRIPVRSALLQLESEGMVTFHPHRGARVRTLTVDQVDEIYRLRTLLETYALRRACQSISPERLEALRLTAKQLDEQGEGGEFLDLRISFYRQLYDADRNPQLVELIEELRSHVGRYFLGIHFSASVHHHATVVRLIAKGDIDGAEEWLTKHLDQVRIGIRYLLEEGQASGDGAEFPTPKAPTIARPAKRAPAKKSAARTIKTAKPTATSKL